VARRVDFRHRHVLQGVSGLVLTTVRCGADEVVVRLEADPAERRNASAGRSAPPPVRRERRRRRSPASGLDGIVGRVSELLSPAPSAGAGGGGARARPPLLPRAAPRLTDDLEGTLDRLRRTSWRLRQAAQALGGSVRMPSWPSSEASTGPGASVSGSAPDCVFGKAMTSRMLSSPARMATRRSMPTAKPPWGGAP
jgi:hypothetical protein